MSGRITQTVDQALDVFYLATLYVESTGTLDPNQIDAYEGLAAKLDFQLGGSGRVCQDSAAEALAMHRARKAES